ncbi:MAG TPA: DoxX family protein [Blastocatellia bacterium]
MRRIFNTPNDFSLTILRLALGCVFFAHGAQKVLGWWGGHGLNTTFNLFTHQMNVPAPFAGLAIAAEFLGGLGLVVGLLGRVAALGIACNMVVAVRTVHWPNGFFMNWEGHQSGEGFEFHILAIAIALAILIKGSGAISFDRLFTKSR